jgi:hypothetical protein
VIDYEVYDRRPSDSDLLIAAIETHRAMLGRPPHMVAADAAFYSAKNEAAAKAHGVKRVYIPNRSTKSPERKREQRKRWFRNGQKWRTGCGGRISVGQAAPRSQPMPLQGRYRYEALGRARRDRRQHHQHRPCHGKAGCTVGALSPPSIRFFKTRRPASGGSCLARLVGHNRERPPILRRKVASSATTSHSRPSNMDEVSEVDLRPPYRSRIRILTLLLAIKCVDLLLFGRPAD